MVPTVNATAATIRVISDINQRRRCLASTKLEVVTVLTAVELATAPLPYDEIDKDGCAKYTQNHRHRDFEGHDDRSADDVGQRDDYDADHDHPGQVGAKIITSEHRHNVGHHQPEEWQRADHDRDNPGGDGHDRNTNDHHGSVVQTHGGSDFLAKTRDGESVSDEIDQDCGCCDNPQQFVPTSGHPGKRAGKPNTQVLEHVGLQGHERRDGAYHGT